MRGMPAQVCARGLVTMNGPQLTSQGPTRKHCDGQLAGCSWQGAGMCGLHLQVVLSNMQQRKHMPWGCPWHLGCLAAKRTQSAPRQVGGAPAESRRNTTSGDTATRTTTCQSQE